RRDQMTLPLPYATLFRSRDDGPVAAIAATQTTVSVDETAGIQGPNEVAGPLAVFAGVANKGTDLPVAQFAVSASAVVSSAGTVEIGRAHGGTPVTWPARM